MAANEMTVTDLARILREAAGADERVDLDADILDTDFGDLGYDSLALLEAGSRIEREYGVRLPDDAIQAARSPRALIALVNGDVAGH